MTMRTEEEIRKHKEDILDAMTLIRALPIDERDLPLYLRLATIRLEEVEWVLNDKEGSESYHPEISEDDCPKCADASLDGCEHGFKSGYDGEGKIRCQNFTAKQDKEG